MTAIKSDSTRVKIRRNVLVMTATIRPLAGIPSLARTDPALRLADYRSSLSFYVQLLGTSFDQLLFVENSASDLSTQKDEVIRADNNNKDKNNTNKEHEKDPKYGRGYGEFRLIDYAVAKARTLQ